MGDENLRERLRERLSALRGELERLPEEVLPEEMPRDASGSISAETARRLDSAASQVETLTRFLDECSPHAARVALLVERRGRLELWRSRGFADGDPRGKGVALEGSEILRRLRDGIPQRLGAGNELSEALGAGDASDAVLLPFVVREKVSGAVYADAAGDGRALDAEAVALATWIAGLVVDRLARRKLVPSPALRPFESAAPAPEAAPEVPPSFASTPEPEHPAAPLPRETDAAAERALGGPLARPAAADYHDEARRFARLLASEIKLYNEDEVSEGRARGDLLLRLRDHIERGRQLYDERVPSEIRSTTNYYYEELLDVLAGGKSEILR